MANLLNETIELLKENNKSLSDILYASTGEYFMATERFIEKANFEYDSSYGAAEIAMHLVLVGKDFWLERHEYDGSEWWEYKTMPLKPSEEKDFSLTDAWWSPNKQQTTK